MVVNRGCGDESDGVIIILTGGFTKQSVCQNTSYQCLWLFVLEWEECMENRILENLQHFLMTKVKEHIILWALLERM